MAEEDLARLESMDLAKITLADVAGMKNDVLRKALISAIQNVAADGGTHTNHWAFQSHAQAMLLDPQVLARGPAR